MLSWLGGPRSGGHGAGGRGPLAVRAPAAAASAGGTGRGLRMFLAQFLPRCSETLVVAIAHEVFPFEKTAGGRAQTWRPLHLRTLLLLAVL